MQFLYSTTFLVLTFFGFSQETFSVYFDSDKYDLTSLESLRLQDWINKNSKSKILSMEGFTDEVGTTSYNDTLSLKRVAFVYNQIHNKIAVREDFRSNGFGEIRQISNNREENRRVTIYYLSEFQISLEEFIINDFQVQKLLDLLIIKEVEKININPKWTLAEIVEKVPIGTMFTLENIQFHFDSADLMLNAKQELDKWLVVLNSNPDLKIIVQGHICCIHKDDILLSSKRARAVLDYLVSKGVEKERIHYVGYGSSRPKFKIPEKNGYEAFVNRQQKVD